MQACLLLRAEETPASVRRRCAEFLNLLVTQVFPCSVLPAADLSPLLCKRTGHEVYGLVGHVHAPNCCKCRCCQKGHQWTCAGERSAPCKRSWAPRQLRCDLLKCC